MHKPDLTQPGVADKRYDDLLSRILSMKWPLVLALAVMAFCVIFSLLPALVAPISADDRYWSLVTPARFTSYLEVVTGTWEDTAAFVEAGRLSSIGRLARRLVQQAVFDVSRLTSTSLVTSLGAAKFLLLSGAVASCLAFAKSLRWRIPGGGLVGLGRASVMITGAALVALLAAGVQTHAQFRNGWISYAPHTYLTISIIFGTAAASVVLARRVAEGRRGAVPIGILASVLFAVLWNWTYELNYVGLPLTIFALTVYPLTPRGRERDQRRGRLIVGGTLAMSWLAIFSATRAFLSDVCTGDECYAGTTLSVGPEVLHTGWFNLASSFPGSSGRAFTDDLERIGGAHLWSDGTLGHLWVISLLLGASLWIVWQWAARRWPVAEERRAAESALMMSASLGSLGVALGGVLIMSVSLQAQQVISRVGLPYRHTVLTWTAIALAFALVARAAHLSRPKVLRFVAVASVAVVVVAGSLYTLPRNLVSTQAYRVAPANRALADIHWEVVAGDVTEGGDERRCQAFERAEAHVTNRWLSQVLEPAADTLFTQLYGQPFCSTWQPN